MNSVFIEGYKESIKNNSEIIGASIAAEYVQSIDDAIEEAVKVMEELKNSNLLVDYLKGFVAERWHTETFNINAAVNGSTEKVDFPSSNGLASPDIIASWGEKFGLKYYKNAEETAKAQSISYEEYYRKSIAGKTQKPSLQEFYAQRNIDDITFRQNRSIYENQTRLVPSDQLKGVNEELQRRALKEQSIRPELADKYNETQQRLVDRVNSPEGNSSIPISENEAKNIARKLKEGEFDAKEHGIDTKNVIKYENIINEALKAGLTAALITAVMKSVPEIVLLFSKAIKNEDISLEDFSEKGFSALSTSTQSFLRGSTAATISVTFKSGIAGEYAKGLNPTLIGVVTAITFNIIENSVKLSLGKISKAEYANSCLRDLLIGSFAGVGSVYLQVVLPIPVLGLLIGSLIGSMVGVFVYTTSNKLLLKLGVESGFTFFNLVEQDYSMPEEVLEFMGLKTLRGICNSPKKNQPLMNRPFSDEPVRNNPKMDLPFIISRDIVGINKIGYVVTHV